MASRFGLGMSVTQPPGFPSHNPGGWGAPYGQVHQEVFQEEGDVRRKDDDDEDGDVETFRVRGECCSCCDMCPGWLAILCLLFLFFICLAAIIVPVAITQRFSLVSFGKVDRINPAEGGHKGKPSQNDSTPTTKEDYYTSTTFIHYDDIKSNFNLAKGSMIEGLTLKECEERCVQAAPLCFGLDYDKMNRTCYLITDQNYTIKTPEEDMKWLHKRRTLNVMSNCRYESLEYNAKPITTDQAEKQASNINTKEKCRDLCEKTFLSSGKHCRVAAFGEDKRCYLYDKTMVRVQTWRWSYFIVDFKCNLAFAPYRTNIFTTCQGTFPPDVISVNPDDQPRTLTMNDTTVSQCAAASCQLAFQRHGLTMCDDFIFDEDAKRCLIILTVGTKYDMEGKVYYRGGAQSPDVECVKEEVTPNVVGMGAARLLEGSGQMTREECKQKCFNYGKGPGESGSRCYGYDYNENACVARLELNYNLSSSTDTTNYRRNFLCEVTENPEFISTIDTLPLGSDGFPSLNASDCASQCLKSVYPLCFGFAFNYTSQVCYLYTKLDYQLGPVGLHPGVVHYRRKFKQDNTWPTECKKFTAIDNAASSAPGETQPWDISTVNGCQDRCLGIGLTSDSTCYSVDFNITMNRCMVNTVDTSLTRSPNVTHYKRNRICDPLFSQ